MSAKLFRIMDYKFNGKYVGGKDGINRKTGVESNNSSGKG